MSDDDDDIPDAQTCQTRVEQFAEITGTDEACAQFYLQDRKWDLERSVNAFFEVKQSGGVNIMQDHDADVPEVVVNVSKEVVDQLMTVPIVSLPPVKPTVRPISHCNLEPSIKPPSHFTFITWNIDGLNTRNLKKRTKAVCRIIFQNAPDVVFLQEVIPDTFSYIENQLPEYQCIAGGEQEYFTATLLRRFTTYYDSHKIIPYPRTAMGRNLLVTQAHIGSLKLYLLNTHLESTAEFAAERVRQLEFAFGEVKAAPQSHSVIFAGDLNLRDKEVDLCGGLPNKVLDLWVACGSRPECRYTWDMTRNTNTQFAGRYKPRCRFDRAYLRSACPPKLHPRFFGLIGLQKVAGTETFPSDHWGILTHFDILDQGNVSEVSPQKKRKIDETDLVS